MLTYRVFEHARKKATAVPVGFNWWSFLFGFWWGAYKGAWRVAGAFFGLQLVFSVLLGMTARTPELSLFVLAACIGSSLWLSAYTNDLLCRSLVRRGYKEVFQVEADSAKQAVAKSVSGAVASLQVGLSMQT